MMWPWAWKRRCLRAEHDLRQMEEDNEVLQDRMADMQRRMDTWRNDHDAIVAANRLNEKQVAVIVGLRHKVKFNEDRYFKLLEQIQKGAGNAISE